MSDNFSKLYENEAHVHGKDRQPNKCGVERKDGTHFAHSHPLVFISG